MAQAKSKSKPDPLGGATKTSVGVRRNENENSLELVVDVDGVPVVFDAVRTSLYDSAKLRQDAEAGDGSDTPSE